MGCGGLLGVNAGSAEPPRMIKLTLPARPGEPTGRLALVGKGIMYDSGGIALKPGDEVHAQMKNDMSGAAAILAAMSALADARLPDRGHRLPDVHRQHAVGHGDGARRRDHDPRRHDRRGDQHRRRGSPGDGRRAGAGDRGADRRDRRHRHAHRRLHAGARHPGRRRDGQRPGPRRPGPGRRRRRPTSRSGSCRSSSATARSSTRRSPTCKNLGGANAGAITAALFLAEFVGDTPWAHIDIAGTAQSGGDAGWQTGGLHRLRRPPARRAGASTSRRQRPDKLDRTGRRRHAMADAATLPQTARAAIAEPAPERGFVQRMLDGIERVGNKVPHPAIIFLGLVGLVIVLSAILAAFDVSVTYDVVEPPPVRRRGGVRRRLGRARAGHPARGLPRRGRRDRHRRPPRSRACSAPTASASSSPRSSTTSPASASSPSSSSR